jgi:hypothetical protein
MNYGATRDDYTRPPSSPQRCAAHRRTRRRDGVRYPSSSSFVAAAQSRTSRGTDERSRPHPSASVAGNDAPRIDERATTRGRSATKGGDGRAGAKER